MSVFGKYKDQFRRAGLSCERFTTAYSVALLFLFVPYVASTVGGYMLWVLPVVCLLPFAVMPLVYVLIHRSSPLIFGRYHLAMPVTGILSALFLVLLSNAKDGGALSACALFFGALMFAITLFVYRYTAFSVRVRLIGDDIADTSLSASATSALGALCALGSVVGFYYYDPGTVVINTSYVLAGAGVITVLVLYFATYPDIPKLGGARNATLKDTFPAFYSGLDGRAFISPMLMTAAFIAAAGLSSFHCILLGTDERVLFSVFGGALGGYAAVRMIIAFAKPRARVLLTSLSLAFLAVAISLYGGAAAAEQSGALIIAGSVCVGCGGAFSIRQLRSAMISVKRGVTSGVVYMLTGLAFCGATAIALLLAAAGAAMSEAGVGNAVVYALIVAGAVAIAALAVALSAKKTVAVPAAGEDYEPEPVEEEVQGEPEDGEGNVN